MKIFGPGALRLSCPHRRIVALRPFRNCDRYATRLPTVNVSRRVSRRDQIGAQSLVSSQIRAGAFGRSPIHHRPGAIGVLQMSRIDGLKQVRS
jgi:hypothetical protein